MTTKEVLKQTETVLHNADIGSARLDSQLLLAHVLRQPRERLMAHPEIEITPKQYAMFHQLIKRRAERVPLVHLTNTREFYGLELEITPDVLTPRVETEQMVEWAISRAPKDTRLIDIGTGSGAIAIAIAKHRPDLEVWATEVSQEALQVAKRNADKHKLNINFVQSDLFDAFTPEKARPFSGKGQAFSPKFETVVTNLPYLKDDADLMPEVQKEPAVALFGGPDGLDTYRRFLEQLPNHLAKSGLVFTECDPWQQSSLAKLASTHELIPFEQGYFVMGFRSV